MNKDNLNPDDARLGSLLREARTTPSLPPRFQEGVWRRIEDGELRGPARTPGWLDILLARVLRPRLALAAAAVLVLAGTMLGVSEGVRAARQDAQARYLAVVAHNILR